MRDAASGEWRIDPAELHRVYPPAHAPGADQGDAPLRPSDSDARLAVAEARLADALVTIEDLRRRLDVATGQLGEALAQVRALTDQRAAPARRWWRWGRG